MKQFAVVFLILILLAGVFPATATVNLAPFELAKVGDSVSLAKANNVFLDSMVVNNKFMQSTTLAFDIDKIRPSSTRTSDFYLLLFLCTMLGIIRFVDPKYFHNLWVAFWNPTLSSRQLKDQLQGAGWPNFVMNVFFAISEGAYIYYVVKFFTPIHSGVIPPSLLLLMLCTGTAVIYLAKYASVKFSGWAFRLEGITEHYIFNVFLINKILGIVLVPFIIVLAFADHTIVSNVILVSFIVGAAVIANRYTRSWQLFGSFFQYSKFHFFMYLCASEILPLAVLIKLLINGLMFY